MGHFQKAVKSGIFADVFQKIIHRLVTNASMSKLLSPFNATKYLNSLNLF